MVEGEEVDGGFFIAHLELAEKIEPAVRNFNNPTARLEAFVLFERNLFPARTDMRHVAMRADGCVGLLAHVARISAQVFGHAGGCFRLLHYLAVQHRLQLADIVTIGSDENKTQRHAFLIHQQMPPCPIFFPDLSGFYQPHHVQRVL